MFYFVKKVTPTEAICLIVGVNAESVLLMIGASVVDKAQSGKLTRNHKDGGGRHFALPLPWQGNPLSDVLGSCPMRHAVHPLNQYFTAHRAHQDHIKVSCQFCAHLICAFGFHLPPSYRCHEVPRSTLASPQISSFLFRIVYDVT